MKRIERKNSVLKMSPNNQPVLKATSGEIVVFETYDCFSNAIQREEELFSSVGWDLINPATGPLYIEGAEAGDVLKVEILEIKIAEKGVMTTAPNLGVLGKIIPEEKTKIISIDNDMAIFNDQLHIPIKPMVGVIGTAPKEEEIPTGTPGQHGGNMDCKRIVEGATLYLPVNVAGGLLAMGDLHAVMGDGEIVVCALEICGEVKVRVSVIKGWDIPLPLLVEDKEIMTIASALTLDEAADTATIMAHSFLQRELKMDLHEAGMLLSLVGDLRICQVVDPLKTARMEIPRWILEKYQYKLK